jgi:hypothetical protein
MGTHDFNPGPQLPKEPAQGITVQARRSRHQNAQCFVGLRHCHGALWIDAAMPRCIHAEVNLASAGAV